MDFRGLGFEERKREVVEIAKSWVLGERNIGAIYILYKMILLFW